MTLNERQQLAETIRQKIIDVMAINGGHLGSNLGIVELSIALHEVFNSPEDRFIFDVSHQTYPHKILTGREKQFPTIRLYKGLSGFSHPEESVHDHFFAGHAGTALPLSLGVAKARDLAGESNFVIPVLGDATFTCGLAFEALNNLPKDLQRFIVILNDNDMSISDNVGAITRILRSPKSFFTEFGMDYIGPLDGHNTEELIAALEKAKRADRPVLLHAKTIKGKGLKVAENNPGPWHGCSPFDKVTGEKIAKANGRRKFPQVFGEHLHEIASKDESIVTVTPAMPLGSCLMKLMRDFPDRCLDVGIAEGFAVTFSGGMAADPEKKVVCSIYSTFLQRAFDNLFHDVCLQKAPVVFALDRSGIATGDGATHHGIYDIGFLNAMPNMVICQPRNGQLLKELLECAFLWKRPTAIRYPNMACDEPNHPLQHRPLGQGEVLARGEDVALIGLGHMANHALKVRDLLAEKGISATVVDPIFVKPLDTELMTDLFLSHSLVASIEEHSEKTGLGAILSQFAMTASLTDPQFLTFGIPDAFFHQGSHDEILRAFSLDPQAIADSIERAYTPQGALV